MRHASEIYPPLSISSICFFPLLARSEFPNFGPFTVCIRDLDKRFKRWFGIKLELISGNDQAA